MLPDFPEAGFPRENRLQPPPRHSLTTTGRGRAHQRTLPHRPGVPEPHRTSVARKNAALSYDRTVPWLVLTGFLFLPAILSAQANRTAKLDAYFTMQCKEKRFTGAVAVQLDAETIFESACGSADIEWDASNTVDTRFRAASIAKEFTAAAILLLQKERRLSVSELIGKFVDGLPANWRTATLHQLLTHTSGIPSYTGAPIRQLDRMGATPRELLAVVAAKPLAYEHGTRFSYNNTGYVLLGMAIEAVSDMRYEDFIEKRLFSLAGMNNSGFDHATKIVPRRARGYRVSGTGLEHAEPVDATAAWSAGGFYSTVGDLVRWSNAIEAGTILGKDSTAQMLRPYPETAAHGLHYGYGIVIGQRFGQMLRYHAGGISGFSSVLQAYPGAKLTIAVLSNLDSDLAPAPSWTIADGLAQLLLQPSRQ